MQVKWIGVINLESNRVNGKEQIVGFIHLCDSYVDACAIQLPSGHISLWLFGPFSVPLQRFFHPSSFPFLPGVVNTMATPPLMTSSGANEPATHGGLVMVATSLPSTTGTSTSTTASPVAALQVMVNQSVQSAVSGLLTTMEYKIQATLANNPASLASTVDSSANTTSLASTPSSMQN